MLTNSNNPHSVTTILPKELWHEIITYLRIKDRLPLKQVSKQNLELIKELPIYANISRRSLTLWQQAQSSGHTALLRALTGQKLKECTIHGGNIRQSYLSLIHDLFWSQIPRECLQTENLMIENLETINPTTFQKCLASCQDLKNLHLAQSTFKGTTYFLPLAAASLSLEILKLDHCQVSELAPALQVLPHLKILILIACNISPTELTYLEPHIQQVNITLESITDISRRVVSRSLWLTIRS